LAGRFAGRLAAARILGHASERASVTAIYDRHSYADENKAVWEKISEHVMALVKSNSGETVLVLEDN
jgi:hypothetical protein